MSNVSDIKPWFKEDFYCLFLALNLASKASGTKDESHNAGFAAGLSSVALAVGVNPEAFLSPEDIDRMKQESNR